MIKIEHDGLGLWHFENFGKEQGIKHFVTDRNLSADGAVFTLSYTSTPDRSLVRNNRQRLADALGIAENRLYFPSQVHKTRIVYVTSSTSTEDLIDVDALMTAESGICIAVMSADCVPILLYDRKNQAVAAVHSGWRGTVAKILTKTLYAMREHFGTVGKDLLAGIGPSVSQDAYEVGEEVIREVDQAFGASSGLMIPVAGNKAKLDLWKANKMQLLEFGVGKSQIEIADLCTVKNNDAFFSARQGDAGRFAAGVMLI
ncbi:MAG TPA: peptidoglycan editing factor PgeF [Ohtaekwangia sp.]|nr:peptidoglycan editing factor PgeF [Ohtaekwangia sp.]